jgi:hypothetical protein
MLVWYNNAKLSVWALVLSFAVVLSLRAAVGMAAGATPLVPTRTFVRDSPECLLQSDNCSNTAAFTVFILWCCSPLYMDSWFDFGGGIAGVATIYWPWLLLLLHFIIWTQPNSWSHSRDTIHEIETLHHCHWQLLVKCHEFISFLKAVIFTCKFLACFL